MRKITLIAVMLLFCGSAMAQDFSFSGQFRERTEFSGKMLAPGGSMDVFHLLRTRLSANAAVNENVTVFIELQDARAYGTESSLMNTGSPAFDLRQGFVKVDNLGGSVFDAKLGRTVLVYANERHIGAVDWSNTGQSFDAAVVTANFRNFKVDVIGAAVNRHGNGSGYSRDEFLTGLWAVWNPTADQNSVQPFFLYDNPMLFGDRVRRFTTGVYTNWMFGNADVAFDGAYQFGELPNDKFGTPPDDKPIALAGYLVGVRAGYTMPGRGEFRVGVGADMISGNDKTAGETEETIEAFSFLYPTNHKFYGFMDYFTSNGDFSDMGLMDIIVQLSGSFREGNRAGLDFHLLNTAIDPADRLPEGATTDLTTSIGMELDLWYSMSIAKAVWATFGFSIFDAADQNENPLGSFGMKTTKWGWIQIMVNI